MADQCYKCGTLLHTAEEMAKHFAEGCELSAENKIATLRTALKNIISHFEIKGTTVMSGEIKRGVFIKVGHRICAVSDYNQARKALEGK